MSPGGIALSPGLSLGVFASFSLSLALLLYLAPRRGGGAKWQIVLRGLLPLGLLLALMIAAWWTGAGTRMTAQISSFHLPAGAAPIDPTPRLMFRIGDRTETADLVVRPYLKDHLNRMFDGEAARDFVTVEAARVPAQPERLQVRLVLHDYPGSPAEDIPGMRVTLNQDDPCIVPNTFARELFLAAGKSTEVHIFRDDNEGRCGTNQFRYKERRALLIEHVAATARRPERIEITLPAPMRTEAGSCLNPRDVLLPSPAQGALAPGYLLPRNLEFPGLGAGDHPRAMLAGDAIGPAADGVRRCDQGFQSVIWPDHDTDKRASLTLGFALLTLPWLPLWLLAAVTGASLLLGRRAQRDSLPERVLLPLLLYLLAIRTMVAIAGATYDAGTAPNLFYRDAALAIILLPPALTALIRPAALSRRSDWLQWLGLSALLIVITMYWFRSSALSWDHILLILVTGGLLGLRALFEQVQPAGWAYAKFGRIALRKDTGEQIAARLKQLPQFVLNSARWLRGHWQRFTGEVQSLFQRLRTWTVPRRDRRWQHGLGGLAVIGLAVLLWSLSRSQPINQYWWIAVPLVGISVAVSGLGGIALARQFLPPALLSQSRPYNTGVLLLVLLGGTRLALIGVGWQERVLGFPISIVYLPLLFCGEALIAIGLLRFERFTKWGCFVAVLAIGLAGIIAPRMARDSGFVLVHLAPIAIVAAQLARRSAQGPRRWVIAAMAAPVAALLGVLALQTSSAVREVPHEDASLAAGMNNALDFNANGLRLLQIIKPTAVELVGTRDGYDQMEQTAMLHSLTDSLTGAGWLAPVELLSIRKEQTWDYVAAVHLMYPFGRIGAVSFLLVVIAAALALGQALWPGEQLPASLAARQLLPRMVGAMAVLTLPFSTAYMILGNLLIVPFTGRDIYLLASHSTGDLIEGTLLLALMALAVHKVEA